MNQCVPLAHGLACSARQHSPEQRRRSVPHGLGSLRLLPTSGWRVGCGEGRPSSGPGSKGVSDEALLGRVSADSDCGGPTSLNPPTVLEPASVLPPPPLGFGWLGASSGGDVDRHGAKSDRRLVQQWQLVICQGHGFGPVEPSTFIAAAAWKGRRQSSERWPCSHWPPNSRSLLVGLVCDVTSPSLRSCSILMLCNV